MENFLIVMSDEHQRRALGCAARSNSDRVGFSEYHDGGSITGSCAIRCGEWKYVHHEDFAPELFNMVEDPDEFNDVAGQSAIKAEEDRCARTLRDLVDTSAANTAAFAAQAELIRTNGG